MKLLLLAIASALVVSCGGQATSADPTAPIDTPSLPPSDDSTVPPSDDPTASPTPPSTSVAPPLPTADVSGATEAVRQFLEENFGAPGYETPWWQHITDVEVEDGIIVVSTNLAAHDDSATSICAAASGFIFLGQGDPALGLTGVEVRGIQGQTLVRRTDVGQPC